MSKKRYFEAGQGYYAVPDGMPVILEVTKVLVGKAARWIEYTQHVLLGGKYLMADKEKDFSDALDAGGFNLIVEEDFE